VAAAAAVDGHVANFHPTQMGWQKETVSGCLCFDDSRNPVKLCLYEPIRIVNASKDPFDKPVAAELACWVYRPDKEVRFKKVLGPICLTFDSRGVATVNEHSCGGPLVDLLRDEVLANEALLADGAPALVLEGYLRFPLRAAGECPATDDNGLSVPVSRLLNTLTLKIETCKSDPCVASPSAAGSPFCPHCPQASPIRVAPTDPAPPSREPVGPEIPEAPMPDPADTDATPVSARPRGVMTRIGRARLN